MLRKLFLLVPVLFIHGYSSAQTFQADYGSPNYEEAFWLDTTPDHGFVLCGNSFGNGTGGTDAMITKTDSAGNMQWSKVYGGTGNELAIYVQALPAGGYVFSGETFSDDPAGDAFIARTDANGNLLWWKNYGTPGYDIANQIKQLPDGTFIVVGACYSPTTSYDAFLMRTDANGDSLWTRTFSGNGIEDGVKVIHTSDNGLLFSGRMASYGSGLADAWLVKTDMNGDTLWTNIIGGTGWDEGMDLIESNGGYLVCGGEMSFGSGLYDVFLMKTDLNGNLLWSKTYGGPYIEDSYYLVEAPTGGYAIAGYTESFGPGNIRGTDSSNAFVIRTDFNGDTLWSRSYGGLMKEECFSIVNTNDGGFAIAGYSESFGDSANAYIFKTDASGISGCNERAAHPDVLTNAPYVQTHHAVNVRSGMTKTVPAISVASPPSIHQSTQCANPLGVSEIHTASAISIFSNPSSGDFTIQLNKENLSGTTMISVYNLAGELIRKEEKNSARTIEINFPDLENGIYFIRVNVGGKETNAKIIIAH